MKISFIGSTLVLSLILLCGCSLADTEERPVQESEKSVSGELIAGESAGSSTERRDYEPMPVEFLPTIFDPNYMGMTLLTFETYNLDQPPRRMSCYLYYVPPEGSLVGSAGLDGWESERYKFEFPSPRPLADLVDYMAAHPDVFFDHSEFDGAPPGEYALPEGVDEYFNLISDFGCGNDCDYAIAKGIVPGEEVPVEIQHVIDELKILRDEILQHPVN